MSYSFGTRDFGYGVYGGYDSPFALSATERPCAAAILSLF